MNKNILAENMHRFGTKNLTETYKVAGREVTIDKHNTDDQTKWKVTFTGTNKTVPYADVISLIKPRPEMQANTERWQDNDNDNIWYEKGVDVKEIKEGSDDTDILSLVSRAEDMLQNLRDNMADKKRKPGSVLQREEIDGYLRAYADLLDILSDIGYQAEMESEQ